MKKILKLTTRAALRLLTILGVIAVAAMGFEAYLYDYKGSSVVKITRTHAARSGGTGFQIEAPSGKKYILTNAHICKMGKNLIAHDQNGISTEISVIEIDTAHDLCIMEPIDGLRSLRIASDVVYHERVWLIGHPALRPLTLESGHFAGVVDIDLYSRCSKKLNSKQLDDFSKTGDINSIEDLEKFLMLMSGMCIVKRNAQYINNIAYGGNSGSPVVDKFGNVIGVLFAGRRDQPTASYTVPLRAIHKFLEDK